MVMMSWMKPSRNQLSALLSPPGSCQNILADLDWNNFGCWSHIWWHGVVTASQDWEQLTVVQPTALNNPQLGRNILIYYSTSFATVPDFNLCLQDTKWTVQWKACYWTIFGWSEVRWKPCMARGVVGEWARWVYSKYGASYARVPLRKIILMSFMEL